MADKHKLVSDTVKKVWTIYVLPFNFNNKKQAQSQKGGCACFLNQWSQEDENDLVIVSEDQKDFFGNVLIRKIRITFDIIHDSLDGLYIFL